MHFLIRNLNYRGFESLDPSQDYFLFVVVGLLHVLSQIACLGKLSFTIGMTADKGVLLGMYSEVIEKVMPFGEHRIFLTIRE